MAVTKHEAGWTLTAAADVASDAGGHPIRVNGVIIVKATAGTVTLKDGDGAVVLLTHSLADLSMTQIGLYGRIFSSFEYDAVSAGTAIVYVFGEATGLVGTV
jgi:hypothetical protein